LCPALEGFVYTRLASAVSAAMRLMPVGQHDWHLILARLLERVPGVAAAISTDLAPMQSFAPALDIAAMSQQYGRSRLFRS
jgi:urease accessory protein UreF